jgi:CHAT domain-containing protein
MAAKILPYWLLIIMGVIRFGTGFCFSGAQQAANYQPSPEIIRLLMEGKHPEAARMLNEMLILKTREGKVSPNQDWLTCAVYWYLSDSSYLAKTAYNIYIDNNGTLPISPDHLADRALCYAMQLASENKFKSACDTLVNSISFRSVQTRYDSILAAESFRCLGRLFKKTGDGHESLRFFERSLEINRKLNRDYSTADDLSNMSSVVFQINKKDSKADSSLREALDIFVKINNLPAISNVYNELGVLEVGRDSINRGLHFFLKSLAVKNSIPNYKKSEAITVLNNLGAVYSYKYMSDKNHSKKNLDSSGIYYRKALSYVKETRQNPAPFYINMGINYSHREDFDKCIEYFQLALASLDPGCNAGDPESNPSVKAVSPRLADYTSYKAHAFDKRYRKNHDINDLKKGLETYLISLEMMDTLRYMYSFDSKPLLGAEFKNHFFQALEMALDIHKETGEALYLDQAFQLSGRNKAATLNEFIRLNAARKYFTRSGTWLIKEDSLKAQINDLQSLRIAQDEIGAYSESDRNLLNNSITQLTDELRSLQIRIRRENPDFYQLIYSNRGYSLDAIRKTLLPGEALLDYTMSPDRDLIVFVVTKDTLTYLRDKVSPDFTALVKKFRDAMNYRVSTGVFNEYITNSSRLYNILIAKACIPETINKLIILPDEQIGFLPFEAFVSDSIRPGISDFSQLNYLNRKFGISYISSHEQLYRIRHKTQQKKVWRIDAFAPFTKHGSMLGSRDLRILDQSKEEIRMIANEFRTKQLEDHKASEERLRHSFSTNRIVHISTHGVLNQEKPMESRILLHPSRTDGSVYLFEILSFKVESPLIFLNACNTAAGEQQAGEGIMSMARGFQFAGASSLITTLWPVDDRAASRIASLFYRNVRRGMDRREALQSAKNTYLDKSPLNLSSPNYWASWVLFGDTEKMAIGKGLFRSALLAGCIFLGAVIFGLWFYRKKRR